MEHSEVSPKDLNKCESVRQATISACFAKQNAYAHHTARYKLCESAVVYFIRKNLQPISVVDASSFLKLVSTLDPRYVPASHSTFSRKIIPAEYPSVKKEVTASLSTATYLLFTNH